MSGPDSDRDSESGRAPTSDSSTDTVRGERSTPTVNSARSLQSRISSVLAAGLMIALGLGALSWYYASALGRQQHARQAAATAAANNAQGEMALPPLGGVEPTRAGPPPHRQHARCDSESTAGGRRASEALHLRSPSRVCHSSKRVGTWGSAGGSLPPYTGADPYGAPQRQAPSDRRLSGAAFARDSVLPVSSTGAPGEAQGADAAMVAASRAANPISANPIPGNRSEDGLMTLLRPGVATPAKAQVLPTQQFLLPKGAFIDCTSRNRN